MMLLQQHSDTDFVWLCRASPLDMQTARWEQMYMVTGATGPALRLLCSCLQPLGPSSSTSGYREFLQNIPEDMRTQVMCSCVVAFLRAALRIPAERVMLPLMFIDEGNAAARSFPSLPGGVRHSGKQAASCTLRLHIQDGCHPACM